MKKILNFINLVLALVLLCGCTNPGLAGDKDQNSDSPRMVAEIIAIGDKIEVEVIEGDYGASGVYWINYSSTTKIVSSDGVALKIGDLSVGDKIEIIYNGQVMMSYPPQVVARKITKLAQKFQ